METWLVNNSFWVTMVLAVMATCILMLMMLTIIPSKQRKAFRPYFIMGFTLAFLATNSLEETFGCIIIFCTAMALTVVSLKNLGEFDIPDIEKDIKESRRC